MFKKIIIGIVIILVIIGVAGCLGSSNDNKPAKDTSTNANKQEQKKETKQTTFKVGDAIKLNNVITTVTNVKTTMGDEISVPQKGNEFVVVNVKIQNQGEDKIAYNPTYFKLQNSSGQITDVTFMPIEGAKDLQTGELIKGGHVEGALVFEAPKGSKGMKLLFQDNILSDNSKITINLN